MKPTKLNLFLHNFFALCVVGSLGSFFNRVSFGSMAEPMAGEFVGVLHIHLDSYRQADNGWCDQSIFWSDKCDPYFIVTAGPAGRPPLARFESRPVDNAQQTVQFGKRIGQLTNPLRFLFKDSDRLDDSLVIEITVKDHDEISLDDQMSHFLWQLPLANLTTGILLESAAQSAAPEPSSASLISRGGSGDQLTLQAWIACRPGRAGPACRVACSPARFRGVGGGFACELATGRRVCLPGFVSVGCARQDPCAAADVSSGSVGSSPFCAHGGECVPPAAGDASLATCRCRKGFGGPRCESVLRPCGGGLGNSPACAHGVCVTSAVGARCDCDVGYQGELCSEDIDECRLVSPCQHDSVCVNTRGGFVCRCRPGFSGRLCQLPPMLLPPPEPQPVAASAAESSTVGSATLLTAVLLSVIAVLALALLLLLLLLWRKRGSGRSPQFVAIFNRRPDKTSDTSEPEDSQCYYESIEDPLQANESPFYADGENFPNAAYSVGASTADLLPPSPPPPPPRLTPSGASHCGMPAGADSDSQSNCYV